MEIKSNKLIRVIIIDVSKPLGACVYDEAVLPITQATLFVEKYIDMGRYRVVTV